MEVENKSSSEAPKQQSNLEDELQKKLKGLTKVDKNKIEEEKKAKAATTENIIQGGGKNFLQNALSTAIRNRRNNLHMHDDEDEDEEDDWD